jgi:hypothetical protein
MKLVMFMSMRWDYISELRPLTGLLFVGEVTGEWRKLPNEELHICTPPQTLLARSNQGECGGRDMWHAWERRGMCTRSWWKAIRRETTCKTRRRWGDGIRMDLRETGSRSVDWIRLPQNRDWWRAVVNTVMNLRVLAPRSSCRIVQVTLLA